MSLSVPHFRKPRNAVTAAFRRLSCQPETRLFRLVAMTAHWLAERPIGARLGKSLRGLINAHVPATATPKALSFNLRSIRRLWGTTLTIAFRLKW